MGRNESNQRNKQTQPHKILVLNWHMQSHSLSMHLKKSSGAICFLPGLNARKPVFGVSHKVNFELDSSATETSKKIEVLLVASIDMIPSN